MPDIGTFLLTWLSYFIILSLLLYIWISILFKTANPVMVFATNWFFGGGLFIVLFVLVTIFALISKFDPLWWFWDWIAQTIAEDRQIL